MSTRIAYNFCFYNEGNPQLLPEVHGNHVWQTRPIETSVKFEFMTFGHKIIHSTTEQSPRPREHNYWHKYATLFAKYLIYDIAYFFWKFKALFVFHFQTPIFNFLLCKTLKNIFVLLIFLFLHSFFLILYHLFNHIYIITVGSTI